MNKHACILREHRAGLAPGFTLGCFDSTCYNEYAGVNRWWTDSCSSANCKRIIPGSLRLADIGHAGDNVSGGYRAVI